MKERPILFSGPMVRAILEGRKTMTRRAVKFPTSVCKEWEVTGAQDAYAVTPQNDGVKWGFLVAGDMGFAEVACPYGVPGDRLWVRETFVPYRAAHVINNKPFAYRADCTGLSESMRIDLGYKWKPSIFMPRWASRITLEVTAVRVERLQEITEEDAGREGIFEFNKLGFYGYDKEGTPGLHCCDTAKETFRLLWDSINGRGVRKTLRDGTVQTHNKKHREEKPDVSWDANPWVWVVEFRRIEK